MDYNGNSISENPFLKQDGGSKRLVRRRPIVIRDNTDSKNTDIGFKMKTDCSNGADSIGISDLEYGPGIVEKLRAKFSKMSEAQRVQKSFQAQAKKFSSCDDLRAEDDFSVKPVAPQTSAPVGQDLKQRTTRSVSDMINLDELEITSAPQKVEVEENPAKSITQLRRRFEKNGDQVAKMRFARDPVALIAKVLPERVEMYTKRSQPTSQPPKVNNVLKVLNDGESVEPEFVRIARRLRRFEPEVHQTTQSAEQTAQDNSYQPITRPTSIAKWNRRQPETPTISDSAKLIRESCDITAVLPTDPHSARDSKQPIPTMSERSSMTVVESSPPPEEPKPSRISLENEGMFKKSITDLPNPRNSISGTVFKYDNPPPQPTSSNFWKSSPTVHESEKLTFTGRYIEDISSKPILATSPNIVSITVKGPSSTRLFSSYEKSENKEVSTKQSPIYTPSYKPISLSSKYVEEKTKTTFAPPPPTPISTNVQSTSSLSDLLLSPREKPYGDDVTILKSDASSEQVDNVIEKKTTTNQSTKDDSDDNTSSDDDSGDDVTGSYDITPLRPNSLMFTRLENEDDVGGDGNTVSRSLISLIAEEDLPDFLVALHEKPLNYVVVEEPQKPSTSGILRNRDVKKEKNGNRIRFCTESPMAYAYLDEITAMRSLQWDDGTIIEYSYLKELEEKEMLEDDPTMSMIEQWEQQICTSKSITTLSDASFTENGNESTLNSAY